MEYISNVVIRDGESESVHRFPARKQHEEFWGWWRNLQSQLPWTPCTSQQWPANT